VSCKEVVSYSYWIKVIIGCSQQSGAMLGARKKFAGTGRLEGRGPRTIDVRGAGLTEGPNVRGGRVRRTRTGFPKSVQPTREPWPVAYAEESFSPFSRPQPPCIWLWLIFFSLSSDWSDRRQQKSVSVLSTRRSYRLLEYSDVSGVHIPDISYETASHTLRKNLFGICLR
jgi:hypothetical protein